MKEMVINAAIDQIKRVTEFVDAQLAQLNCPRRIRVQLDVAIDEILSNIARYAYKTNPGKATVRVEVEEDPRCVSITFIDRGMPYDPVSAAFVDTTHLPARERPIGGLGVYMVKKTMDDVIYSYKDGQNILTIRKKF